MQEVDKGLCLRGAGQEGNPRWGALVLSRLRSGLSTHLCGLPLESQGAFAAER